MQAYRALLKKGKIEFLEQIPDLENAEVCVVVLSSGREGVSATSSPPPTDGQYALAGEFGRFDPITHAAMIEWMNAESDDTNWEEAFNVDRG